MYNSEAFNTVCINLFPLLSIKTVKGCVSLSQCDADINQAHLTCCLPHCSRWHVYLKGGAVSFISTTHLWDFHQPFMFFSFAGMAAFFSMAVMQPFVMAYYLLDVILHNHKCRSHLLFLVRHSVKACLNSECCFSIQTRARKSLSKRFTAFKKQYETFYRGYFQWHLLQILSLNIFFHLFI